MAGAGVVTTLITTPDTTRTLSVFAGGMDLTPDAKWSSLVVTDSGASSKGTASLTIEKSPHLLPEVTDQALFRVVDHSANGGEVFRGFIRGRVPNKDPMHPTLEIIADDLTSLLDDTVIDIEYRWPESMQARLGFLWGKYAGQYLSGDFQYVKSVGSTLPAQRFELVSLRQAIEMTLAQTSSTADYYVSMLGQLHVFTTETNAAPKNIDADAPDGTEIAPENLTIEYDSNSYYNRVYVQGANPESSAYFQDDASITAANGLVRTGVVQAPDCTTYEMAESLGLMYLGRVKAAKPRGSFQTSSAKADGWRGGQNVLITSAAHGLSAQSHRIARVTTRVIRPGANLQRSYDVEFGGAKAGSSERLQPILSGATAGVYMLDQLGNQIISNAASANIGGLGPALRRYVLSGIYNSDFYAPPPGPEDQIDNATNPLPYWDKEVTAGTVTRYLSVEDSTAASGRRLEASILSGSGVETSYISQRVPILANEALTSGYILSAFVRNTGGTTSANVFARLYYSFRNVNGDNLGAAWTDVTLTDLGAGGSKLMAVTPGGGFTPDTAYFLDVKLGLHRTSGTDTGEVEFAAVRLDAGVAFRGAWVDNTAVQAITTSTWTAIQYDEDLRDAYYLHDPVTNNSRFTVPWTGKYLCIAQYTWAATTATVDMGWSTNGGTPSTNARVSLAPTASVAHRGQATLFQELGAGSYFEFKVWQNSGADLNIQGGVWAIVMYMGEAGS